ncbi:MAG: VOC family protein [Actinomycetota bacterium]
MTSPIKFAHVVLKTTRYREMLDWWLLALGASVRHGNDFISFISYDDEHHRLAIVNFPGLAAADRQSSGVEHFAFTFGSLDDLFAKFLELRKHGVTPYWTINHGMTLSAYYRDPDGNQVEFQVDAMSNRDAESLLAYPLKD